MGNDLLIATLAIESDREPDWEAAFTHVQTMTRVDFQAIEEAFEQWMFDVPTQEDGEIDVEEFRERLKDLVGDVKAATETEHRHLFSTEYIVPGWTVYITGGDSWGDAPSEEWDMFHAFLSLGLAEKAGFATRFVSPPTTTT